VEVFGVFTALFFLWRSYKCTVIKNYVGHCFKSNLTWHGKTFQVFGYSQFHILAHHVVIGNQVIVRGTRRHLVRSVIDALKVSSMLP